MPHDFKQKIQYRGFLLFCFSSYDSHEKKAVSVAEGDHGRREKKLVVNFQTFSQDLQKNQPRPAFNGIRHEVKAF